MYPLIRTKIVIIAARVLGYLLCAALGTSGGYLMGRFMAPPALTVTFEAHVVDAQTPTADAITALAKQFYATDPLTTANLLSVAAAVQGRDQYALAQVLQRYSEEALQRIQQHRRGF